MDRTMGLTHDEQCASEVCGIMIIKSKSIVSHAEGFGDTLVDQILWSWLFGSAAGKLIDRLGKLLGKVDFDDMLGLSKLD